MHWGPALELPGTASDLVIKGETAYVVTPAGLSIIDVTYVHAPLLIANHATPEGAAGVAVEGRYAYLTVGSELHIIDVSDPRAPTLEGRATLPGPGGFVAVDGDLAAVLFSGSSLAVVDVSDVGAPRIVGQIERLAVRVAVNVALIGHHALVGCDDIRPSQYLGALRVVDLSDRANLQVVAEVPLSPVKDLTLNPEAQLAFVATYRHYTSRCSGGEYSVVRVFDISRPDAPVLVDSWYLSLHAYQEVSTLGVAGDLLGVTLLDRSTWPARPILRVIDTASPGEVAIVRTAGAVVLAGSGSTIWTVGTTLRALTRIGEPVTPIDLDRGLFEFRDVALGQGRGYVIANKREVFGSYEKYGRLQIYDISAAGELVTRGELRYRSRMVGLAIGGTHAYLATEDGAFHVVESPNPDEPRITGSVSLHSNLLHGAAVAVMDSLSVLAMRQSGVVAVLSVTDPSAPRVIATFDTQGPALGVDLAEWVAYIAVGESGLEIVDLSDPRLPDPVALVDTPGLAVDVDVHDGLAYVADTGTGIQVIDISDPTTPYIVGGTTGILEAQAIVVRDSLAYLASGGSGLTVVDVSNPIAPLLVGGLAESGSIVTGVAADDAYVYLTNHHSDCGCEGTWCDTWIETGRIRVLPRASGVPPEPVELIYLVTEASEAAIEVRWGTSREIGITGYHIHRRVIPGRMYAYRLEAVGLSNSVDLGPVDARVPAPPASLLFPAQPNPFPAADSPVQIRFALATSGWVQLQIVDPAGRPVRKLLDAMFEAGTHYTTWDGFNTIGQAVPSGAYFYRLRARDFEATGRLVLLR
jgi:hypothetical protein